MKFNAFLSIFISSSLFADYAYQTSSGPKIDMHGGKKQPLIEKKQDLSKKPFLLENISIQKNIKDKKEQSKEDKQNDKN